MNNSSNDKISDFHFASTRVDHCQLIDLTPNDTEGMQSIIVTNSKTIPFDVRRIYYLFNVPEKEARGGHAHKALWQLIVAINGSFNVALDDGAEKRTVTLSHPKQGLLIVPGIWRELNYFTPGVVCLVLASQDYDEEDYIRSYDSYLTAKDLNYDSSIIRC